MREAVIVSTARTPIGKAYRGAFNNLESPTMAGHAIREAVTRVSPLFDHVSDEVQPLGTGEYASLVGAGATTTYAYDALNRRTQMTEPLGHLTSLVYDEVGNPIQGKIRSKYKRRSTHLAEFSPEFSVMHGIIGFSR